MTGVGSAAKGSAGATGREVMIYNDATILTNTDTSAIIRTGFACRDDLQLFLSRLAKCGLTL